MEDGEKPISIGETLFVLMLVAPIDLLEMIIGPIFFIGPLFIFIDIAGWFAITIWLTLKGVDVQKSLGKWGAAGLVELIPFVEILPIRTITLARIIHRINSSQGSNIDNEEGAEEAESEVEEDLVPQEEFEEIS